jgi:hypothetical protein
MEDDFVFPDRPADLCDPRCELPLRCADLVDVSGLEKEELDEFVDSEFWRFFSISFGVVKFVRPARQTDGQETRIGSVFLAERQKKVSQHDRCGRGTSSSLDDAWRPFFLSLSSAHDADASTTTKPFHATKKNRSALRRVQLGRALATRAGDV